MRWGRNGLMLGGYMTCMGMYMSGFRTGMGLTIMMFHLGLTPGGHHPALFASAGAVASAMVPRICGRRIAAASRRAAAATTLACVFSGFITLDLFYPLTLGVCLLRIAGD